MNQKNKKKKKLFLFSSIHVFFPSLYKKKHSERKKKKKKAEEKEKKFQHWRKHRQRLYKDRESKKKHRKNYLFASFYYVLACLACLLAKPKVGVETHFCLLSLSLSSIHWCTIIIFYSTAWNDNVRLKRIKLTLLFIMLRRNRLLWHEHRQWKISYKGFPCR